eukprot:1457914-Ditylum_brightwellii.AAC.1
MVAASNFARIISSMAAMSVVDDMVGGFGGVGFDGGVVGDSGGQGVDGGVDDGVGGQRGRWSR